MKILLLMFHVSLIPLNTIFSLSFKFVHHGFTVRWGVQEHNPCKQGGCSLQWVLNWSEKLCQIVQRAVNCVLCVPYISTLLCASPLGFLGLKGSFCGKYGGWSGTGIGFSLECFSCPLSVVFHQCSTWQPPVKWVLGYFWRSSGQGMAFTTHPI